MFPDNAELLLQAEYNETLNTSYPFTGRAFLYDFTKGDFIYKNGAPVEVTGVEAIRVWIEKVIRTEKFKFTIYQSVEGDIDYGTSIEDLIGTSLPQGFVESELKRELTESILKNPFIEELTGWLFEREGSLVTVNFTFILIDGAMEGMEVAV